MAAENYTPTFIDLSDLYVLLNTVENLAAHALEESDRKTRSAILWSVQKMMETAQKDIQQMMAAEADGLKIEA